MKALIRIVKIFLVTMLITTFTISVTALNKAVNIQKGIDRDKSREIEFQEERLKLWENSLRKFKDKQDKQEYVWQTCYGPAISRILASLIALHGDDNGLILPFCVAPTQVVIVPIYKTGNKAKIMKKVKEVINELCKLGIRVEVDNSEDTPGEKFYNWELQGVPLRIELGERELKGKLTLFLRDLKKRVNVVVEGVEKEGKKLDERLREKADDNFKKSIVDCNSLDDIKNALKNQKIARCDFCSVDSKGEKCASIIERKLIAFVRGVRHDKKEKAKGKCVVCGKKAGEVVYIARSY